MDYKKAQAFQQYGKKIVAALRNYREHALEMGDKEPPGKPVFFFKPTTAYITGDEKIKPPNGCKKLQHEVELGVVIGRLCKSVTLGSARDYVGGYVLSLDMTARDFQEDAKRAGHPWLLSKGFDTSCPVSRFISKDEAANIERTEIWCKVNGEIKQRDNTSNMIHTVPRLVEYISQFVTLEPGDVILTGTPSGVSTVKSGDLIECGLEGIITMQFTVA